MFIIENTQEKTYLDATSVAIKIDLSFDLNLFNAPKRLFWVILPYNGIAVNPSFLSMSAVFNVFNIVAQNIITEQLPISFNIYVR